MRLSLRNLALVVAILGGTALVSGSANATPTLVGTTTNPTGIDGLVVDGTIYNVTFSTTTLNTFTAGTTLSVDAATALKDALNTLGVIAFFTGEESDDLIDVDNSLVNFDAAFRCVSCQTPWAELGGQNVLNLGFNQGAQIGRAHA